MQDTRWQGSRRTFRLRVGCIGQYLIDHKPGIRVFFELDHGGGGLAAVFYLVSGDAVKEVSRRGGGVHTWFNRACATFCYARGEERKKKSYGSALTVRKADSFDKHRMHTCSPRPS